MFVLGRGISSKHNSGHHDLRPLLLDHVVLIIYWLVVEPNPSEKDATVKMGSSSPNRGENKKYLKPPGSIDSKIDFPGGYFSNDYFSFEGF